MNKPSVFRLVDVLTLALPALMATILGIYVTGFDVGTEAKALMFACAAGFWFIYLAVLWIRKTTIDKITFVSEHGMYVITNGLEVNQEKLESICSSTAWHWSIATNVSKSRLLKRLDKNFLIFKDGTVKHMDKAGALMGYVQGNTVVVKWMPNLVTTALAHELGHLFHHEWSGIWDEKGSHTFMKNNDLR